MVLILLMLWLRKMTPLQTSRGITLLEILVAISIIGLVTMVAVPNFLDWNRKYKLKSAVGELQANMSMARMNAINQNTAVTVTVTQTATANPVTVTFRTAAGADVISPMTMDSEVSLTNAANAEVGSGVSSPQDVRFNSKGLRLDSASFPATGNAGNNICLGGGGCGPASTQVFNFKNTQTINYRIVVAPTGKVSWCYSAACTQ